MFPAVLSGGSQRYSHCASGYHVLALYGKTKLFRNQLNDWTVLPPNYTRSHVNHDTNRENKDPQFFSGMQRHKKKTCQVGNQEWGCLKQYSSPSHHHNVSVFRFWWRGSGGLCAQTPATGRRRTWRWPAGTWASRAGSGTTGTSTSTTPPSSRSSSRTRVSPSPSQQ